MPTFSWGSIKFQGHFWNISQPFSQISWCPEIPRDLSEIILEIISENISKNISDRYPRILWRFHGIYWRTMRVCCTHLVTGERAYFAHAQSFWTFEDFSANPAQNSVTIQQALFLWVGSEEGEPANGRQGICENRRELEILQKCRWNFIDPQLKVGMVRRAPGDSGEFLGEEIFQERRFS